jgi:hypothetical protein
MGDAAGGGRDAADSEPDLGRRFEFTALALIKVSVFHVTAYDQSVPGLRVLRHPGQTPLSSLQGE